MSGCLLLSNQFGTFLNIILCRRAKLKLAKAFFLTILIDALRELWSWSLYDTVDSWNFCHVGSGLFDLTLYQRTHLLEIAILCEPTVVSLNKEFLAKPWKTNCVHERQTGITEVSLPDTDSIEISWIYLVLYCIFKYLSLGDSLFIVYLYAIFIFLSSLIVNLYIRYTDAVNLLIIFDTFKMIIIYLIWMVCSC